MPEIMQQQQQPKPRGRRKKIRTEPIRPICPQCEKQFSNQSALTKHKLTHSDERKFACHQCSKAFKRHDHLTGHMQTHSNRKPFNCTIQGCDKTYCDARSLRRHKENIHHIVTPKEHVNNNQQQQPQQQQQQQVSYQQQQTVPSSPSSTTSPAAQHEPSHLLRRRIQRLNSDPGAASYQICASANSTEAANSRRFVDHPIHHSANPIQQHQQQQHYHATSTQPGSYSADYAATQQFSFDFEHINQAPMANGHGHQHQLNQHLRHSHNHVTSSGYVTPTQPGSAMADFATNTNSTQHFLFDFNNNTNQMTPVEQQYSSNGGSIAQSAESLNDSSLGLSIQYEQQAPIADTNNQQQSAAQTNTVQQHHYEQPSTYQQPIVSPASFLSPPVHQEPSHLLQRRIQRLNSDPGAPNHHSASVTDPNRRLVEHINPATHQHHQQHYHHHPQASYSADYASTQQFSFDFEHINQAPVANNHHQHHHNNQHLTHSHVSSSGYVTPTQPGSAMADFATNTNSTQHFLFDFNNNNNQLTPIEQQFSSNGGTAMAQSAESLNDSSLGLSIQYEHQGPLTGGQQQSTQTTTAPTTTNPVQQQQQYEQQTYQQQALIAKCEANFPSPTVQHESSHLLQRRIQRLNSDPGAPYHAAI